MEVMVLPQLVGLLLLLQQLLLRLVVRLTGTVPRLLLPHRRPLPLKQHLPLVVARVPREPRIATYPPFLPTRRVDRVWPSKDTFRLFLQANRYVDPVPRILDTFRLFLRTRRLDLVQRTKVT